MKKKFLLSVCLIGLLSCVSGVVRADSETPVKCYLHKDAKLLSQHLRIKLLEFKEIECILTYNIQIEDETVENPILYSCMEGYTNPLDEMIVMVNYSKITTPSLWDKTSSCERWEDIQNSYNQVDSLPFQDTIYFCNLPISLEKGMHSIDVRYRLSPHASYIGRHTNEYFYEIDFYSFPTEDLFVEIFPVEKEGVWSCETEPLTRNILKQYKAGEQPENYLQISVVTPKHFIIRIIEGIDYAMFFYLNSLVLFALHGWLIIKYRKKHKSVKISYVSWLGAIGVSFFQFIGMPFLYNGLCSFFDAYDLSYLDDLTLILFVGLSIVVLIFYIPVALLFDYIMKKVV